MPHGVLLATMELIVAASAVGLAIFLPLGAFIVIWDAFTGRA